MKKKKLQLTKATLVKLSEKELKSAVGGMMAASKWD
jgi:hypothetical protein